MLTAIREGSKGWIAWIIIGLIVITFALFGISSYLEGIEEVPVATVNGEEIDLYTYQNQLAQQRQALLAQFGGDFDPALLDTLGIKDRVIDSLIDSRLLSQYANERNYRISDTQLAARIQENTLFHTDGQFDPERYAAILESSRMTPQAYEESERQTGLVSQLQQAIQGSAFTIDSEVSRLATLQNQRRDVSYAVIPAGRFVDEIEITDEEARAEYEANMDSYQRPARMKIEYIDLSVSELAAEIDPAEEDIQQTYERVKGRFLTPEIRKASHILFAYEADGDDAARQAVREQAESVLAEINAGSGFAELAKVHSDDPGSAVNGGDLGVVARGQMAPPFEEAVFSLGLNEVSDLVETQFGLHIIKLTELSEGAQKPLEEVREEIVEEARTALAEETFADLVEPLQNLIFEQPDSLTPAADELGLEVRTSDWFSQNEGTPDADDVTQEGAVRRAAFAQDVLEDDLNSQAIELGFDRVVAVRKAEYEEAAPLPFDEVKDQIVNNLKLERSAEKVWSLAEEQIETLTHSASFDIMVANLDLSARKLAENRQSVAPQNTSLAETVYALDPPAEGKPTFGSVELPGGDVAVYALNRVEVGEPAESEDSEATDTSRLVSQLEARDGGEAFRHLMTWLRSEAEITIDREQL